MSTGAKHIHEAHGEEKLIFDEADSIWERIMETDGSAGGLLRMAWLFGYTGGIHLKRSTSNILTILSW
jgi:hypothetical protein